MVLLLLCYDIVVTSIDIFNKRIVTRPKQQRNKRFAEKKKNKITEKTLIVNMQSGNRTQLPSTFDVHSVLVLVLMILRWIIS